MSKPTIIAALILLALVASGCYRTNYINFGPPQKHAEARAPQELSDEYTTNNGWQHFFLYGWIPGQRNYAVDATCGGADRIESINTRQTFLQGLVRAVAGFYINIYSPYNAKIECKP